MKKVILVIGLLTLLSTLGLRAYFSLVPPPPASLAEDALLTIVPASLPGWEVDEQPISDTPEGSTRVADFLNFDQFVVRTFTRGETSVTLYVAYWTPGKASYRWAGAHTPDTCWVQAGWTRTGREHGVPVRCGEVRLKPGEFGTYTFNGNEQQVYFWHLIGDQVYSYDQTGMHNIFGALLDIRDFGLDLRDEQFFIRLSSNRSLDELRGVEGFESILASLAELGLEAGELGETAD